MAINITEDIKSITDLKLRTTSVLEQVHKTKRPVILTVNGKVEAILMDAKEYEKIQGAFNLLKLLVPAEGKARDGKYTEARQFFKEFRRDKKI